MTERNTTYLRRFDKIIKNLSEKHGVDEDEIRGMIDHFFFTLKRFITDPRMPTIKITNFGTLKPSIGKLNWQIKNAVKQLRKNPDDPTRLHTKIRHLWAVKQRLIKEKNKEETWKEWRNKKIDL